MMMRPREIKILRKFSTRFYRMARVHQKRPTANFTMVFLNEYSSINTYSCIKTLLYSIVTQRHASLVEESPHIEFVTTIVKIAVSRPAIFFFFGTSS